MMSLVDICRFASLVTMVRLAYDAGMTSRPPEEVAVSQDYPDMIQALPAIDVPFEGVRGRLLQGADNQVVFFEIDPIGQVPIHTHGDQWGVVIEGEMDLTIGGQTRTYTAGDTYFIPAGVEHGATFRTLVRVIDVFADRDRYRPQD